MNSLSISKSSIQAQESGSEISLATTTASLITSPLSVNEGRPTTRRSTSNSIKSSNYGIKIDKSSKILVAKKENSSSIKKILALAAKRSHCPPEWDERQERELNGSRHSTRATRNNNADVEFSTTDKYAYPKEKDTNRNQKRNSCNSKQNSAAPRPRTEDITVPQVKKTESEMSNAANIGQSIQYSHPFFSLSETIRVKILKHLSPTERLLAQFVCRRFRNDIRLRVGIRTKVTEDTVAGLTFLRDVLVTSVLVGKYDRPMSPPSKLIYNPENIQEIIFVEPICVQNLDAFLNRCRKIKWLIIQSYVVDQAFPSNTKAPYAGYEWRSLDIINRYPVSQPHLKEVILCIPGNHCLRTVNRSLALLNTPSLEKFSLIVNQAIAFEETTAVHFAVLNYLKNCLNVTHVIICTEQRSNTIRYASRSGYVVSLERELNQFVEKLHLHHLVLTEPAVAFETWNIVLNNQNALEVLQVLHMTIWPLLRDIVMINFKTLVKVALHAILWDKYGKHSSVDLAVFNRSVNLKELYICVAGPAAEGITHKDKGYTDFINFHKLPKHLEIFALKHCHINIKDFLYVRNLLHLKSLGIVSLGLSDGNYIGINTLRKLVHIRSLEELFISGLAADAKDSEELKTLIAKMKAKVNHKKKSKIIFHSHGGSGNRWSMTKSGSFIFTIFSDWGFMSY